MPVDEKVLRRIQEIVGLYPEEVMDTLLDATFWPTALKTDTVYIRRSDDTEGADDTIRVSFSRDSDAWVEVLSMGDPDPEADSSFMGLHRFRSYSGGGRSLRVRNALLFLARAIQLDNEETPDPPR